MTAAAGPARRSHLTDDRVVARRPVVPAPDRGRGGSATGRLRDHRRRRGVGAPGLRRIRRRGHRDDHLGRGLDPARSGHPRPVPVRFGSAQRSRVRPRLLRGLRRHPAHRHPGQRPVGPGRADPEADQPAHLLVRSERVGEDVRARRGPGADPPPDPAADGDLRSEQRLRAPRRDPAPRPPGDGRSARRPSRTGAPPRRRAGRPARPAAVHGPGLPRGPDAPRPRDPPRGVQRDGAPPAHDRGTGRSTISAPPCSDPTTPAARRWVDGWRTSGCSTGRSGPSTIPRPPTSSPSARRRRSSISAAWSARRSSSPSP